MSVRFREKHDFLRPYIRWRLHFLYAHSSCIWASILQIFCPSACRPGYKRQKTFATYGCCRPCFSMTDLETLRTQFKPGSHKLKDRLVNFRSYFRMKITICLGWVIFRLYYNRSTYWNIRSTSKKVVTINKLWFRV